MNLPGRHSLLWRLAGALALFCLLLVSLHVDVGRELIDATSYLSESTRQTLKGYAREAETTWREEGAPGVDASRSGCRNVSRSGLWWSMSTRIRCPRKP